MKRLFALLLFLVVAPVCLFANTSSYTGSAGKIVEYQAFEIQTTPEIQIPTQTPNIVTPTAMPSDHYKVVSGDTLEGIASSFGIPTLYLAEANNITDINFIGIDQLLFIPKWPPEDSVVVVVIDEQKVYVYQDRILLKEFVVSTGRAETPTVLGHFWIGYKTPSQDMSDPERTYYLKDVPWVQFFGNNEISWHEGYSFHGTFWHSNFGTPMSHGCVNMTIPDADWLYHWTRQDTQVWAIQSQP